MNTQPEARDDDEHNYAFYVVGVLLIVAVAAIVIALLVRREPDYALVLATPQDCLRAFDDTKCRAIVAHAMDIHAATAPRFDDQRICEMQYGAGNCTPVSMLNAVFYAPAIAAIVIARARAGAKAEMLPLYYDSADRGGADGRRVFYAGRAVGILHDKRFGGAAISVLTDLSGKPFSSTAIAHFRG
jgi:uncharacterized protein YgiB involved in biofilm formation